jgi:dihydroorotate dehydrogenase (NAD+) catalytic subunit
MKNIVTDLSIDLGALKLKNPVLAASGTFGYAVEFSGVMDVGKLGGVVTKGLSLKPRRGNPPPRVCETPSGMLNAIGLENVGFDAFASDYMPRLRALGTIVVVNFFGETVEEYAEMAGKLDAVDGVDALEVNISCPNVSCGGISFGKEPESAAQVTAAVRARTSKPLIVKLSPVSDVVAVGRAVEKAGANIISCMNTIPGMMIDIAKRRPRLANVTGGLSGPAVKPIALKLVHDLSKSVGVPVIGIGGIMSGEDVVEFALAGASAVQVGTATFWDPAATSKIVDGLQGWCSKNRAPSFRELVGALETGRRA